MTRIMRLPPASVSMRIVFRAGRRGRFRAVPSQRMRDAQQLRLRRFLLATASESIANARHVSKDGL